MAETSLVPTVIALSEFFAENFPNISWYPYWYLGNPYQFLIGPVVPTLLAIFNFPFDFAQGRQFSITQIYLGLIFSSFLVGSVGIYLFLRDWGVNKKQAFFSGIFYVLFPAGYFLLNYQNGLNHVALSLLPFFLLYYRRFLKTNLLKGRTFRFAQGTTLEIFLSIIIVIVLLINISILLSFVIGAIALIVAEGQFHPRGVPQAGRQTSQPRLTAAQHHPGGEDAIDKIIKTILIFLLGISLATIWYTPRFWWILLSNPSLGGISLFNLILSLIKALFNFLLVILAILIVKWRHLKPQGYLFFGIIFLSSFSFLTLTRFLLDPDFVADWIGFLLELQFGMAIIGGYLISKYKKLSLLLIPSAIFTFLIIARLFNCSIAETMKQCNNETIIGYQNRIQTMLKDNVKPGERVFLSGSSVFFINQYLDIQQVRGGVDQVSIHPFWANGAYQIREGEDSSLTKALLSIFGASYVLVHEKESEEYYRDFKHPEKFNEKIKAGFELITADKGDLLYKVKGVSIGRIASKNILKTQRPLKGDDSHNIYAYAASLNRSVDLKFENPKNININAQIKKDELI